MTHDEQAWIAAIAANIKNGNRVAPADISSLLALVQSQAATIETLTQEREAIVKVMDDFALCDVPKTLAQRIADELADYTVVMGHCSEIYCDVTSSRISKPMTLPSEVLTIAGDLETERTNEAIAEETAELKEQADAAEARCAQLTAALRTCETENDSLMRRAIAAEAALGSLAGHPCRSCGCEKWEHETLSTSANMACLCGSCTAYVPKFADAAALASSPSREQK